MSVHQTLIIPLIDQARVRIDTRNWPIIAQASGDRTPAPRREPREQPYLYSLTVRQHADGRTLVHGEAITRMGNDGVPMQRGIEQTWQRGAVLPSNRETPNVRVPAAITQVGNHGWLANDIMGECINQLPIEDLDADQDRKLHDDRLDEIIERHGQHYAETILPSAHRLVYGTNRNRMEAERARIATTAKAEEPDGAEKPTDEKLSIVYRLASRDREIIARAREITRKHGDGLFGIDVADIDKQLGRLENWITSGIETPAPPDAD